MPLLLRPIFNRTFVFLYLLGIVSSIATVPEWKDAHMYSNAPLELFLDVYVMSALLCLVPKHIIIYKRRCPLRAVSKGIVYAVTYPLYIIDTFCWVKFGSTLNPSMLLLLGETNSNEASEFFSSYVTVDVLFSSVGLFLLIPLLHVACALLWKKYKDRVYAFMPPVTLDKKIKVLYHVVVSLPVVALLAWSVAESYENKMLFHHTMTRETIGEVEHDLAFRPHVELYQPSMRLIFSIYSNELISRQLVRLRETTKHVVVDSCEVKSPNIVLIIGESFNKRHAQLYGYDKPNMPNQVRMMKQGLLTPLADVVSPWNLTSFVFKHLMTTYCVGDSRDWCDYPLFCQIFRKAGYQVNFFTNQFLPQAKEAVYDFSGGFFINDPELSKAQFDVRNTRLHVFDQDLLIDFDHELPNSARAYAEKPQLTIFHLMGQHVNYRIRCPQSKKKWNADDYPNDMDMPEKHRKIMADYDNAVWYNDSVVNLIVERFKNDEAIIIYLSDHGEEVFDKGARHFFGRMHNADITKRLADEEFRIPMWIYCTPKYAKKHPDVKTAIRRASKKPYMSDAVSHLLLGLAGIHCPYYNPRYDLLSPQYDASRKRILKHTTNYDEL